MVQHVASLPELQQLYQSSDANRLFVLDFYADWCGPCRMIAPFFEGLSRNYTNATFIKVNVDVTRDISSFYQVRAMPTFVFVKNNSEVDRFSGANQSKLESIIKQFYSDKPANPNAASAEERLFLQSFAAQASRVYFYNDLVAKTLALSLIPSDRLIEEASVNKELNRFQLAKLLLGWFKMEFFSWFDSPPCPLCNIQIASKNGLNAEPTREEKEDGANRVEIYYCACGGEVRFPRFNNPAKLLETRTGRCGEWANCFTLMAAALDFDTRFVYDVTDHVWCELFIPELDRWVHCDPCENTIDAPLLYEKGWGKKLSYVIAFGVDHVTDVTWRYVINNRMALKRRTRVRENVLTNFLTKLNARMSAACSNDRNKELARRRIREIIEVSVLGDKKTTDKYGGRTTGDEEWRRVRGELGASPKKKQQIVLRPNDKELGQKKFTLRYNCASDMYTRGDDKIKGFSSFVYKSKDIMRKTESDWKKAYICRKEGKGEGEITWAVDLTGVKAKSALVKINGLETYENGNVFTTACADDVCMILPSTGELYLESLPSTLFKITTTFSGGCGDNAFQHAQLFRTDLGSVEDQLVIEVDFE